MLGIETLKKLTLENIGKEIRLKPDEFMKLQDDPDVVVYSITFGMFWEAHNMKNDQHYALDNWETFELKEDRAAPFPLPDW